MRKVKVSGAGSATGGHLTQADLEAIHVRADSIADLQTRTDLLRLLEWPPPLGNEFDEIIARAGAVTDKLTRNDLFQLIRKVKRAQKKRD